MLRVNIDLLFVTYLKKILVFIDPANNVLLCQSL